MSSHLIFHFPPKEKEISSFLMIQETANFSVIFLEKSSFQNIWKKKIWFFVQCDNESNFENLLDKNKEITIHQFKY